MNTQRKIITRAKLAEVVRKFHRRGEKVVFTNGCFDILHVGHVSYLEAARNKGDALVIGLNSDSSVRAIKGPKRPIVSQQERARVIAALDCVDYLTVFNEETPLALIKAVKPDVLVKGADWKGKKIVGADIVKKHGGNVELIKYLPKFSTTKIIERIVEKCNACC